MNSTLDLIKAHGIVSVLVTDDPDTADDLGRALADGGVPVVEVTMRTPNATRVIARMANDDMLLVGAGTVLSRDQVGEAADAGAKFVVSPCLDPNVIEEAHRRGLACIPGVMTPTELQRARELSIRHVKFFPAEYAGGLKALAAFASVYPDARFMPTGGLTPENATAYLQQPFVFAIGGTWIASRELIRERSFDIIRNNAQRAAALLKRART